MQRYIIFFIIVNALHVSGGFSAHHQELKNCTYSTGYMPSLLAATASVGALEQLTHASGNSKQPWHTGCPGENVPDFGRLFLKLKYTDITQNTYIRS